MDDLPPPQYAPWMNEVVLEDAAKASNPFVIFRQDDPYDFGDDVGSTEGIHDEGGMHKSKKRLCRNSKTLNPFRLLEHGPKHLHLHPHKRTKCQRYRPRS